jgi:hypothetical protein
LAVDHKKSCISVDKSRKLRRWPLVLLLMAQNLQHIELVLRPLLAVRVFHHVLSVACQFSAFCALENQFG